MTLSDRIVRQLGGTSAIARLVQAPVSTVHSWRRKGIPPSRLAHLKLAAAAAGREIEWSDDSGAPSGSVTHNFRRPQTTDELWVRAEALTGIKDRDVLLNKALRTFIEREAAKGLIALGGTMPDFTVPPRERPLP